MKVLVTGHNGYIGSVMVPVLQAAGHSVVGLDTFYFEDCLLGGETQGVSAIRKDLRDVELTDLQGFEAVVHLAALCNDPIGDLNSDWTHDINYEASVRLARMARETGVRRFFYASAWTTYGAAGGGGLPSRDGAPRPLAPPPPSQVGPREGNSPL